MWKFKGTRFEGEKFEIQNYNVWDYKWINTGEKIKVKDPLYQQTFIFTIWKIIVDDNEIFFCSWRIF